MADVIIYTTPFCPYCMRAKSLLDGKGVTYEEIDLYAQPGRRSEMIERSEGRTTVPQIFIDGRPYGRQRRHPRARPRRQARPAARDRCMTGAGMSGEGGIVKAACVQVNAGTELEPNLRAAGDLVRRARDAGAEFIALPENVGWIVQGRDRTMERIRTEAEHPGIPFFADLARETGGLDPGRHPACAAGGRAGGQPQLPVRRRRPDRPRPTTRSTCSTSR